MVLVRIFLNDVLINDSESIYAVYFRSAGGNDFGTSNAILVEDSNQVQQTGNVAGEKEINFEYDYENNNQGGRIPNTDADIIIVGIGKTAKYKATKEIITNDSEVTFVLSTNSEN